MSTTIDIENAKQIRASMEVYCGISAENTAASETISNITAISPGTIALQDTNATNALKKSDWEAVRLADLSGGGFPLDEGVVFPVASHTADSSAKYGVQGSPGGSFKLDVVTTSKSISVTCDGEGGVDAIYNGQHHLYTMQNQFAVPVPQGTTVELQFLNTSVDKRIVVYTIVPGVVLSFTLDNLASVVLDLAGNLSKVEPSFEVSSIEINAFYPDDIADVVSAVGEDAPLWYYAGYDGDYCETRNFYLSDKATQKNKVITLKGVDASHLLEEKELSAKALQAGATTGYGLYQVYTWMRSIITSAGIKLRNSQAMANPGGSKPNGGEWVIAPEQSAQKLLASIMLELRDGKTTYWPTYVDAGIPTLYCKMVSADGTYKSPYQLRVWDIYEEDCGDVVRDVEKNINIIRSSDDTMPIIAKYDWTGLIEDPIAESKNQKVGGYYAQEFSEYYAKLVVTNASKVYAETANCIKWVAKNVLSRVYGYGLALLPVLDFDAYVGSRPGVTISITPSFIGMFRNMAGSGYLSRMWTRFTDSNITGSFTFKGDPRMQPRDTFKFHRLDGTVEVATIERIQLTHEGGGTTAEVHYRLGVM